MKIITVSREFGSGGRELGKRLSDVLGFAYYDREIVVEVAKRMDMDETYIANAMEKGLQTGFAPIHYGQTFSYFDFPQKLQMDVLSEQRKLLQELAEQGDCVIVGRAADVILESYAPFNLFVYADMDYKIRRCQSYSETGEGHKTPELERMIKKVDRERAKYHELFDHRSWGDKVRYHLCVNTTGREIKALVPALAEYIQAWFQGQDSSSQQ